MTKDEIKDKLVEAKLDIDIILNDLRDDTVTVDGINSSIEDLIQSLDELEATEDDWS